MLHSFYQKVELEVEIIEISSDTTRMVYFEMDDTLNFRISYHTNTGYSSFLLNGISTFTMNDEFTKICFDHSWSIVDTQCYNINNNKTSLKIKISSDRLPVPLPREYMIFQDTFKINKYGHIDYYGERLKKSKRLTLESIDI